jgi:two-component system sensor histidine kinase KdpD
MNDDRPDRDLRPSPEALLEQSGRESRGRLKVFLGAAPGVGKTYEMLSQGRQRRLEGVDAVIGVVETHGRVETDRLTKGFEIIPKKRLSYKGRVLAEMDLDAILQRRPKVVLVDELAHTNVPGSRHPKRYLDVQEILDAGIDVYTTLNVQHLESLNDVVARITRIRVRETVPDSIFDRADDVELVDLTPEDLIQRLNEGKVYVPEQAQRAVAHYFMPGNLTALRELALRRTAQRVDEQMVNYMRAHAIQGPWEASERVLVSVGSRPGASALVRYGRRLADRLRASWTAAYVETSEAQRLNNAERDRIAEALRVAERLGGDAVTVPASSVADGIIEYAQANNFTHIVVASTRRSRLLEFIRPSAAHEIIRRAGDLSIHVVPEEKPQDRNKDASVDTQPSAWNAEPFVGALGIVAVALMVGLVLRQSLAVSSISLVFITGVLISAITYGRWPALFASFASALAYNFFFLPPLYKFTISDPENVVTLFFFALVAVIASNLTARVRDQVVTARERAKVTEDLYLFSRKLAGIVSLDDLLWATVYQIAAMLKVRVVLLLPDGDGVSVRAGYPPEDMLDDGDLAAARWAWEHSRAAGRGADTLPGAKRLFLPMRTGRGTIGIIGLDNDRPGPILSPDQRRLLDALSDQAALAVERVHLVQDIDRAKLSAETERLRSALLTSISHDLRTPLASILGSATSLKAYHGQLDEKAQDELIATIQDESERLNRFINNLLDMTRLESGAISVRAEATDLTDVIGSALRRASKVLSTHHVKVDMMPELPMPRLDGVLLEQVIFNLLDNAAKYAPGNSEVCVKATSDGALVRVEVTDEGEGIPPGDLERIFDKFYRVHAADRRRAGTGLGLAICRGFIETMGGTITAGNRTDRPGAIFTVTLPVEANAPRERAA